MELGCYINIDSFSELKIVEKLMKKTPHTCKFGIRVNPIIGSGSIAVTSTAAKGSKFGIELDEGVTEKLIKAFKKNRFLEGLHVHVGS